MAGRISALKMARVRVIEDETSFEFECDGAVTKICFEEIVFVGAFRRKSFWSWYRRVLNIIDSKNEIFVEGTDKGFAELAAALSRQLPAGDLTDEELFLGWTNLYPRPLFQKWSQGCIDGEDADRSGNAVILAHGADGGVRVSVNTIRCVVTWEEGLEPGEIIWFKVITRDCSNVYFDERSNEFEDNISMLREHLAGLSSATRRYPTDIRVESWFASNTVICGQPRYGQQDNQWQNEPEWHLE